MKIFIGVAGFIFFVLIAVLLLVGRNAGGNDDTATTTNKLMGYVDQSATFSYTIHGRLVGETERRSVRISITPSERRIEILNGYNNVVERTATFPNTTAGYKEFVAALEHNGYAKTRKTTVTDVAGMCATGNQYLYVTKTSNNETPINTWSTSCSNAEGTFGGKATAIRGLFQAQIPDYNQQLDDVRL